MNDETPEWGQWNPLEHEKDSELVQALNQGDLDQVKSLIEAGEDIRYKRSGGYDALLDAVHGHDVRRDPHLLESLQLLIAHGVDLNGISSYGEAGLRVLSRGGRFDAVRLLLEAGADRDLLEWTALMEAVALGTLDDVQAALDQGAELEATDWWSRTPWLIALTAGDIAKAELLLAHGADPNACGRCGQPHLFYAIESHHPDVLRWLIERGTDIHQTDQFGHSALIQAVTYQDYACVDLLLRAGANIGLDVHGTALNRADTREIVLRLLEAGADTAELSSEGIRAILGLPPSSSADLMTASPQDFQRAFTRVFGKQNPERMNEPFWESMIRSGLSAYAGGRYFDASPGELGKPIWCAQRFGQSLTMLPDGRYVQIGGEHEDYYDPDFCIYNDVFVHGPDRSITIFGYPENVFPPTDFHTATLVGDHIYVIGSLGYAGQRRYGQTPVYRLDTRRFRIAPLKTSGELPGWIHNHRANLLSPREIVLWGGTVLSETGEGQKSDSNPHAFVLNLDRLTWRRVEKPNHSSDFSQGKP